MNEEDKLYTEINELKDRVLDLEKKLQERAKKEVQVILTYTWQDSFGLNRHEQDRKDFSESASLGAVIDWAKKALPYGRTSKIELEILW